jgi:hypothetical protein
LTRKPGARQKVETDGKEMRDLLFPHAHFEIDKPVHFDLIAHANQLINQIDNVLMGQNV